MSEFRIDVLNASGTRIGDGPLNTVLSLSDTRRLDGVGSAEFAIPAEDPRAALITAGAQFDCFDRVDRYLGRYYYRTKKLDAKASGGARLVVTSHDQLIELARTSARFRRTYTNQAVNTVVNDLVTDVASWTTTVDGGIGNTSVIYDGQSILLAVDVLRDRWNKHFRLGGTRELEFGAFGADSGVVLTNLRGQVQGEIALNTNLAIVESIGLVEEGDEIFNRIIPLGAGQGVSQLTIAEGSGGLYSILTGTNEDGSDYYYIEDTASIALYGLREKVLTLPSIRPITNSDTNIDNAATALKLAAEAYIARHLAPKITYSVNVRGLRTAVSVGDLIRLQYRGVVDGYAYIDVDEQFYVMDVTRKRDSNGSRSATLTIATIAERRTQDTDVLMELVNDVRALKISVPITLAYSPVGPYTKRIADGFPAEFTVRIGAEVTFLNYAILRFRTSPLKSSVTTVSTDSGSTPTSSSGGSQTPTSSSGGSSTPTSSASSSSTTASGGSSTPTSSASSASSSGAGGNHFHEIDVVGNGGLTGNAVKLTSGGLLYWDNATNPANPSSLTAVDHSHNIDHTHTVTISSHTHGMDHTHTVSISAHTHTVTISAHTHTVTIPSHNHTLTYGIYQDSVYPQLISVAINGVDRTVELGGQWALTNAAVEVEVEITQYLVEAAGGLRQNHRISFSCISPGQGEIECEVDMLMSIQAIAVS